jgi:hypothetical protein
MRTFEIGVFLEAQGPKWGRAAFQDLVHELLLFFRNPNPGDWHDEGKESVLNRDRVMS